MIKVSSDMLVKVSFGMPLSHLKIGTVARGTNPVIRRLELPGEGKEAGD